MGILRKFGFGKDSDHSRVLRAMGRGKISIEEYCERDDATQAGRFAALIVRHSIQHRAKIARIIPTDDEADVILVVAGEPFALPSPPRELGQGCVECFRVMCGIEEKGGQASRRGQLTLRVKGATLTASVLSLTGEFGSTIELQFGEIPNVKVTRGE